MSDGIGFLILIGLVLLISGPAGALIALRARRKVREVEARLTSQELQTEYRLSELTARLYGLEHPERQWEMAPEAAMEPVAAIPVEETPAPPEAEVEPEVVLAPPVAAPPSWGERVRQRVGNEEWEAMIGGSWLNKAGVLVLVIGIALFVAFSLTRMGPGGRVAVGVSGGLLMLAGGVGMERRARYRVYARGLIGGGWAALYFSVYAAHEIAVARVIDDPVAAMALLFVTSLGMIVHSLRYRSQAVTGLAYFVSFGTLAIAPLTPFSVAASIPLAASLLYLARRFDWSGMALAGLVTTYVVYLANAARSHGGSLAAGETVLFLYWVVFECFDLTGLRQLGERSLAPRLMFPLNAVGLVLISWLQYMKASPGAVDVPFGLAAVAYFFSMVARLRLLPPRHFSGEDDSWHRLRAGSYEGALTVAAALAAIWIPLRLTGHAVNYAYLAEAEALFLAGWYFGQGYPRRLAGVMFVAPLFKLAVLDLGTARVTVPWAGRAWSEWTGLAAPNAALFYGNRLLAGDGSRYGYLAAALGAAVLGFELPREFLGVGWLAFAGVLFETGVRARWRDFRWQGYGVAMLGLGALGIVNILGVGVTTPRPDWIPQAMAAGLATLGAVRIYFLRGRLEERDEVLNVISSAAAVMAATVAWNVLPPPMVALAWGALALLLGELGAAAELPFLRLEAYAMNAAACGRLFMANFTGTGTTGFVSHRLLTVGPIIGLQYYLRSRVRGLSMRDDRVGRGLLYLGAILAAVLLRFELGHVLAVDGWAVLGLLLVWLGVKYGNRDLRVQSYALALVSFWRAWTTNFQAPEMYGGMRARVLTGAIVIAAYYISEFVEERNSKPRLMFSLLGTVLLAILLFYEVSGRLLTVAWGLQGAVLLAGGFPARERSLRVSGLGLLLLCILKLFVFDLRQLETPYRILSFIVLGLLMLAVSWVYTQFRERIQRYL